jgi:nicotinamide-nucleotide amidase
MARGILHILTIGDELLAGDIVDRNSAFLATRCRVLGLEVHRHVSVRDRIPEIVEALRGAAAEADACLVSGGLGPTTDDLTAQAVAEAAGVGLVRNGEIVGRLEAFFASRGREVVEANRKQADLPDGAEVLDNPVGTAPGFWVELRGEAACVVACMPGVPHELHRMMTEQVEPRLRGRFDAAPVPRRIYRAIGHGESSVQEKIRAAVENARKRSPGLANALLHYRAHMPEVLLNFEGLAGEDGVSATVEELRTLDAPMSEALGKALYGIGEADLPPRLIAALRAAGASLCTAESCTGGLVGATLTEVPGASEVFAGGVVSYSNEIKTKLLGVPDELIQEEGAVSEAVARAMARGARETMGSDLSVSITGIAGPDGGSGEKPVGTVHFAVCDAKDTSHKRVRLYGNRGTVRRAAATWALKLVWDRLVERGQASIEEMD